MKSLSTSYSFIKTFPRNNNPISNCKPKPTQRQLFIHKLSASSPLYQTLYKTVRPSLFSNPSTFFSSSFDGREVIIGKKNSSFKISSLSPAPTRVSSRKSILQVPQRSMRKSSVSVLSSFFSNISLRNAHLLPNQQYIDEIELKRIYDDFKSLRKHNSTSCKATHYTKQFTMQERALNKVKENEKETNKIIARISKKSKRNPNDLLLNRVNSYRIKKELQNELNDEVSKMNASSVFEWQLTLRRDPTKMDVNYVNLGSVKYPNWQRIVKGPLKEEKEIIRSPSLMEGRCNKKEVDVFFKNAYLKEIEPYKSRRSVGRYRDLDLEVKGKDLLEFEYNNAKMLKRNKIISVYNLNEDMKKEEVYEEQSEPVKCIGAHIRKCSL